MTSKICSTKVGYIQYRQQLIEILFESFQEYRKFKGWPCPSKIDIEDWENWKILIMAGVEAKNQEAKCLKLDDNKDI